MNSIQHSTPTIVDTKWFPWLLTLTVAGLGGFIGLVVGWGADLIAGREVLLIIGVVWLWVMLQLSMIRFDVVVFLSFALFGIVEFEPAPSDMLLMLLTGVGIFTGALRHQTLTHASLIHLTAGGFLVITFLSMFTGPITTDVLRYQLITTYMLVILYFLKMYITSPRAMRVIMLGYTLTGVGTMVLVFAAYFGVGGDDIVYYGRASGLFKDSNVFGPFLILPILWLIDEIRRPTLWHAPSWIKTSTILILCAGVFVSGSRAAWGNLLLSLIVYSTLLYWFTSRRSLRIVQQQLARSNQLWLRRLVLGLAVLLFLVLPLCIALPIFENLLNFITGFFEERARFQIYDSTRFARQLEGIGAGLTHLIGVGPGGWENAHSLYVRTFAEHGIFGLLLLFSLFLILIVRALSPPITLSRRRYGLLCWVPLSCFLGHLLNSIVIDTIHWRHFWAILALVWITIPSPSPTKLAQDTTQELLSAESTVPSAR